VAHFERRELRVVWRYTSVVKDRRLKSVRARRLSIEPNVAEDDADSRGCVSFTRSIKHTSSRCKDLATQILGETKFTCGFMLEKCGFKLAPAP
jgi:hypothetical protein